MIGTLTSLKESQLHRLIETASSSGPMSRRDALKYLLGGAAAATFAGIAGPSIRFLGETYAAELGLAGVAAPTYTIKQEGALITATPTRSVALDIAGSGQLDSIIGTDATTVINEACQYANSKVFIRAGTYIIGLTGQGALIKGSNFELYGEPGTILKMAPGVDYKVLRCTGPLSNINIHDLEIDGNIANGGSSPINNNGISTYEITGLTIQNCYIHDTGNFGINGSGCSNVLINNNRVVNSGANAINIGGNDPAYGGYGTGGWLCTNNVLDTFSDVGLTSWEGYNVEAHHNTILNGTISTSHQGGAANSHWGMGVEISGTTIYYHDNNISNCLGSAFCVDGADKIRIINNTVSACGRAFYSYGGTNITVSGNTFDKIATVLLAKKLPGAFEIESGAGTSTTITNNKLTNLGPYLNTSLTGSGVVNLLSGGGTFGGNTVSNCNGKYIAIANYTGSSWTVSGNTITA